MVAIATIAIALSSSPVVESHRIAPSELPCARVTGLCCEGSDWLVGGLHGLFIGAPDGPWKSICNQAVRSIVKVGQAAWVVYGNGAVDKIELKADRLYYDVLQGSKRAWVDTVMWSDRKLYFGGQGGWIEKSQTGMAEQYPVELKGAPVEAIARVGSTLWLGTEDGAFADQSGTLKRFGFGAGLRDVWVTALIPSEDSIIVGLAAGGLARISGESVEEVPAPTKRVRSLFRWNGYLVLGSLDGTWLMNGSQWAPLADGETFFVGEVGKELVVGTPTGLHFFRLAGNR